MKTWVKILKIAYWLLFVWCFITGILNANTLVGAALSAIAALQCMLMLVYNTLNDKIDKKLKSNNN